jgi:hypothetical protein
MPPYAAGMRATPCTSVPSAALLLASILLAGCIDSEVGYYDITSVTPLVATCAAGIDAGRAATWIDTVRDEPINEFRVGSEDTVSQAQFFRPDDSVFLATISNQGEGLYAGETITENATVGGIGLGADFSALLEADSVGCEFDLRVETDFTFIDDEFAEANGSLAVEMTETQLSDNRCSIVSCLIEYGFILSHTGGGNPGLWSSEQ